MNTENSSKLSNSYLSNMKKAKQNWICMGITMPRSMIEISQFSKRNCLSSLGKTVTWSSWFLFETFGMKRRNWHMGFVAVDAPRREGKIFFWDINDFHEWESLGEKSYKYPGHSACQLNQNLGEHMRSNGICRDVMYPWEVVIGVYFSLNRNEWMGKNCL